MKKKLTGCIYFSWLWRNVLVIKDRMFWLLQLGCTMLFNILTLKRKHELNDTKCYVLKNTGFQHQNKAFRVPDTSPDCSPWSNFKKLRLSQTLLSNFNDKLFCSNPTRVIKAQISLLNYLYLQPSFSFCHWQDLNYISELDCWAMLMVFPHKLEQYGLWFSENCFSFICELLLYDAFSFFDKFLNWVQGTG